MNAAYSTIKPPLNSELNMTIKVDQLLSSPALIEAKAL